MASQELQKQCEQYLQQLCVKIPERCVGSEGNRQATRFFEDTASSFGWHIVSREFDAMDWQDGGAVLRVGSSKFDVFVSPYSLGCTIEAELIGISTIDELEHLDMKDKLLLMYGDIAKEQLMPKNFVFYNPAEHQRLLALLEHGQPAAIICATGRNAALAGGVYPFPLIEDGDFDIPSVYMTDEEGRRLLPLMGNPATLQSNSKRIPGKGYNPVATKGTSSDERIVITAHIDAKKGTPGAIDNATGIVVLLVLANLLEGYAGERLIELVAFNGEDYYSAPGQMVYLAENQNRIDEILLNINIDGAGYHEGQSAFSFYGVPLEIEKHACQVLDDFNGIERGVEWYQGDHSIFLQNGVPAIAVSSAWFTENMDRQEITHTAKDNLEIVDCHKVIEIAEALHQLLQLVVPTEQDVLPAQNNPSLN